MGGGHGRMDGIHTHRGQSGARKEKMVFWPVDWEPVRAEISRMPRPPMTFRAPASMEAAKACTASIWPAA